MAPCEPMNLISTEGELVIGSPALHDDIELDAFLATHFYTSMYLRAEMLRSDDRSHFAVGRVDGSIVAVAVQVSSGMVLLQAPVGAAAVARAVLVNTKRRLAGFFGAIGQVSAARKGLGLDQIAFAKDTHEDLFTLPLNELLAPPRLATGLVKCRVAAQCDVDVLVAWRAEFRQAVMKDADDARLREACRSDIEVLMGTQSLFILETDEPLACCSFNARLPDAVNIGNVWTPQHLRGKGYARSVVAGALAIAATNGVRTAVLATGRHNLPAQAAYRSIGFKLVGDYATAVIAPDTPLPDFLGE